MSALKTAFALLTVIRIGDLISKMTLEEKAPSSSSGFGQRAAHIPAWEAGTRHARRLVEATYYALPAHQPTTEREEASDVLASAQRLGVLRCQTRQFVMEPVALRLWLEVRLKTFG